MLLYKRFLHTFYYFHIAVQSIFSLLSPIALMTLLAFFLSSRGFVEKWIYVPLILLGVATGLYAMLHFVLTASRQVRALEEAQEEKQREQRLKNAKKEEKSEL